jgi:PmbA protein
MLEDRLDLLADLVRRAQRAGADAADAVLFEAAALQVTHRLGKPEDLERAESRDLGLRAFVGRRSAVVSSNDFEADGFGALAERAVAMARAAPEDPYSGLADPDLIAKTWPELELDDGEEPSADALYAQAAACEAAALAVPGVTNSEEAGASWSRARIALAASNGFAGDYAASSHGFSVSVLAGEGAGMERDYDHSAARWRAELTAPEAVGRSAGERAVARLEPRKVKTQKVPVVFDPRVSRSLLGHFAGAISGVAVARGTSFLKDRLGAQVFAEGVEIVDDPHRRRGLASKPFDGEGVANRRMALVEGGVLQTWLLDTSSARQLGLRSAGHASRGTSGPPGPSTSNLYMAAGPLAPEALIGELKAGFYVTELIGFGVNAVTGDYSRGAAGFWIEDGERAFPVSELTIAGNLKDMFLQLTPASDLVFRYGSNAPTIRIEGMTVAGA